MKKQKQETALIQFDVLEIPDETTDPIDAAGITLPLQADITDAKIITEVKKLIPAVDVGDVDGAAGALDTQEKLNTWFVSSLDSVKRNRQSWTRDDVQRSAASMAQFWYISSVLSKALASGRYGSGTAEKLAEQAGISPAYIYSIKLVADRLTLKECYLLGSRMVESSSLRTLAHVVDDDKRGAIVKAFLESCTTTSDRKGLRAAKAKLIAAATNGIKEEAITVDHSSELSDEPFQEAINAGKQLKRAIKVLDNFINLEKVDILRVAIDNCYVSYQMPNAERVCEDLKALAKRFSEAVDKAAATLGDFKVGADSIASGLKVLQDSDLEEEQDE